MILKKEEQKWFEKLANLLGLVWSKEDLLDKNKSDVIENYPDKVIFPLSLLMRPEIWQMLRNIFHISDDKTKEGMPHVPSDAVSMFTQSKDEFMKNIGMGGQRDSNILNKIINNFDKNKNKSKMIDEYPALKPSRPRKLGE